MDNGKMAGAVIGIFGTLAMLAISIVLFLLGHFYIVNGLIVGFLPFLMMISAGYREEFEAIIHEVQDILRNQFTLSYRFIGSSAKNMITCDFTTNKGFDFDVNLYVNDDEEDYTAKEIKLSIMRAINQAASRRGFCYCEDSTRVITLKKRVWNSHEIAYSCDFAIVYDWIDKTGIKHQQYIRYQKNQNNYVWAEQPKGYNLDKKVKWIKDNKLWDEVLDLYLYKKNYNDNPNKKSRALYAETINEICQQNGYREK